MINSAVSASFETWQANASEGKDAEAAAEEGSDEDDQAKLAASFGTWRQAGCRCKHDQQALRRAADEDDQWQAGSIIGHMAGDCMLR